MCIAWYGTCWYQHFAVMVARLSMVVVRKREIVSSFKGLSGCAHTMYKCQQAVVTVKETHTIT